MYTYLLSLHSIIRWFVLASLLTTLFRSIRGWAGHRPFTLFDNTLRHTTATVAHVQLALGYILYFKSPVVTYFREHYDTATGQFEFVFFGILHIALMTAAVVIITIGSSVSKRQLTDNAKFRTMTLCFVIALIIICIAIPWPFSPLADRPWIRTF